MESCASCRFWEEDRRSRKIEGYGECGGVDNYDVKYPHNTTTPMAIDVEVSDDTGLVVRMMTKFDFGCKNHQPRH
jgi:hypothetical protein